MRSLSNETSYAFHLGSPSVLSGDEFVKNRYANESRASGCYGNKQQLIALRLGSLQLPDANSHILVSLLNIQAMRFTVIKLTALLGNKRPSSG